MTPSAQKPTPKHVVQLLIKPIREQTRDIYSRQGGRTRSSVPFHVYLCPKCDQCTKGGEAFFEKGSLFSNPYGHLKRCIAGGSEENLLEVYRATQDEHWRAGSWLTVQAAIVMRLTCREKAMYSYLRFIILKSLPMNFVEDSVRDFSKHEEVFVHKTFKKVLFTFVELVEECIRAEMTHTKGALMHDGWTHNGTHYVGLFALYCRKDKVLLDGKKMPK